MHILSPTATNLERVFSKRYRTVFIPTLFLTDSYKWFSATTPSESVFAVEPALRALFSVAALDAE